MAKTIDESIKAQGGSVGRMSYVRVIFALLARDLAVLRKTAAFFVIRVVMQPLLFVFVFTYVFPKIGQGVGGGGSKEAEFSTLLVAGVVGISIIFQAIQAVALPLVQEFGYTKEIEDRALAPMPTWGLAIEKILSGAVQAVFAGAVVFPIVLFVPATPVHLHIDWPVLITLVPLAAIVSGTLGLTIGTLIPPNQVALIFAIIVLPITFLGAVYYPWASLTPISWLKDVVLVNPLVYINEGLRAALTTGVPHMEIGYVYLALIVFALVLGYVSIKGLNRRVVG
ncbi:ABC-2 type transport system permease protein [Ferrithrix thermotolerans DSM 19514]|uniref:Transport permease protein n=1 Tax=Ferrithrix thermotolerans DSM 19514 TaxID=1121881 RepID=A0A1M4WJG1_9ACTN|nr:ABC transporter permease [Ferrithrix thermotolerans]SHE81368.1 ABC-2 type transport system permease protein [Ferrithrix thermotolerans DSM 19514]